jgi:hypothetical protein
VPRAIEHVIITTGASRMLRRSDVYDCVVNDRVVDVEDIIETLNARHGYRSEPFVFPTRIFGCRLWKNTGWTLNSEAAPSRGGWLYELVHDEAGTVVRCWVCLESHCSGAMWANVMSTLPDERVIITPPHGVPWLAVAVLSDPTKFRNPLNVAKPKFGPGILTPEISKEAVDLARCIAWAIVETEWPKNEKPATP